ncbi:MAG TPA: hypothetical protein VFW40_02695 [Capsulimonadaceae bacterium]|nr:hypothetical protein [Capsulimonadaceae bacterium]
MTFISGIPTRESSTTAFVDLNNLQDAQIRGLEAKWEEYIQSVAAKIQSFTSYGEGWDGEGAEPVSGQIARKAISIVRLVGNFRDDKEWVEPFTSPSRSGGVDLVWQVGDHRLVVIVSPRYEGDDVKVLEMGDAGHRASRIVSIEEAIGKIYSLLPQRFFEVLVASE